MNNYIRQVKPYTSFSEIYSHLMRSVDYKFWAEYITTIHQTIGSKDDIALELAAGNCKLAKRLKSSFKQIYVTDISSEMLKKCSKSKCKVCCDMLYLPFKREFDFIYSAFDSVNYINEDFLLGNFFKTIKNQLTKDGYFLFDVSLKKNSKKYVRMLNRNGKYKQIKYKQVSTFDEESQIHKNIVFLKFPNGEKFKEVHIQKIYDFYYYFDVIDSNDLYVVNCFDAFDFTHGSQNSERVQFVVKRKN